MNTQDLNFIENQDGSHTVRLGRPKKKDTDADYLIPAVQDIPKPVDKTNDYRLKRRNEIINGRFNYISKPGATLNFSCWLEEGDTEKPIKLKDGEMAPLKRKQAEHLNKSGIIPVYKQGKDAEGREKPVFSHNIKRWYFENYDFFEIDEAI